MKKDAKVIDCTLRDGGIMNNWDFSIESARKIYQAAVKANVEIIEIGYRVSKKIFNPENHGIWKFCDENDITNMIDGSKDNIDIAVMADIGRCYKEDFLPKKESSIDIFRLACYVEQIDEALEMSDHLNNLGYKTMFNIMAVSTHPIEIVSECLKKVHKSGASAVYLADTFGAFKPEDIKRLLEIYKINCPNLPLGYHGHNNTQLALANSIIALQMGVEYIDASLYGMGRGAGNCPLELLLPAIDAEKYDISYTVKVIQDEIEPLMDQFKWGYRIPYAITGILNRHPKSAIEIVQNQDNECYGNFYEKSLTAASK